MRAAIVAEAKTWLGTPYKAVGRIKGVGISCAMLVYMVVRAVRAIPEGATEPKWYSGQVHLNSTEDRMIDCLIAYGGREIEESAIQPGDIVFYKTGLSFGHIAIGTSSGFAVTCIAQSDPACMVYTNISDWPANSIPLGTWTSTVAGAWDASGYTNMTIPVSLPGSSILVTVTPQ